MFVAMLIAAAVQTAQPTLQQEFDRATALSDAGKPAEALAVWEALETRAAKNRRTLAIVRIRKSDALFKLARRDDAVAAARAGLAGLPAGDATLNADRAQALISLGNIAEESLDYAGASQLYSEAEGFAATPAMTLGAQLRGATTAIFVDLAKAAATLDRADALLATTPVDAKVRADFRRQRALLLINTGDYAGARRVAGETIKLLGGMTSRVDQRDVMARSDAAIAALLGGDADEARRYMAMTGAGRLGDGKQFDPGLGMTPPDCGGEAGLKPDDVAVVGFSIGKDGSVIDSYPVYAAGGGPVALEFARAARRWSWTPEQLKGMPPFFRYNARVEMRCSTGFERPSLRDMLGGDLAEWLGTKGVAMTPPASVRADAMLLPKQRAALAAAVAKHGDDALATVPPRYELMTNRLVGREETHALATRALAIVAANGAPPLASLAIEQIAVATATAKSGDADTLRASYARIAAAPRYAGDPSARSVIRLFSADVEKPGSPSAAALLRQVADDPALPANDPLKIGALVRIASAEQAAGRPAEARAAFDRSGLSAAQCALVDTPPRLIAAGGEFPMEAMTWGFEGWTQVQADISADGKATNPRVIISYPPFVFTKAGRDTIAGARFAKTYRPDGGLGCGGQTQRVRFKL